MLSQPPIQNLLRSIDAIERCLRVPQAIHSGFFQRADGQQTFHKNFEQLDETTELLR